MFQATRKKSISKLKHFSEKVIKNQISGDYFSLLIMKSGLKRNTIKINEIKLFLKSSFWRVYFISGCVKSFSNLTINNLWTVLRKI